MSSLSELSRIQNSIRNCQDKEEIERAVVRALELEPDLVVPILINNIYDKDRSLSLFSTLSLVFFAKGGSETALSALAYVMLNNDAAAYVHLNALEALDLLATEDAFRTIAKIMFVSENQIVLKEAIRILGKHNEPWVKDLFGQLKVKGDPWTLKAFGL